MSFNAGNVGSVEGTVTQTTTTDTFSCAVPDLGADRFVLALFGGVAAGRTLGSATWNGVAMTAAAAEVTNGNFRSRAFYLLSADAPAENGTYNLVLTWTGGTAAPHSTHATLVYGDATGAITFDAANTSGTSGTSATPTPTVTAAAANEFIASCVASDAAALGGTPIASPATQLQSWDQGADTFSSGYLIPASSGSQSIVHNFGSSSAYSATIVALVDAGVANDPPTIVVNTADAQTFATLTPSVDFTGSDTDSDPLRYTIRYTDNPAGYTSGEVLTRSFTTISALAVHPQPSGGLDWQGNPLMDDLPGNAFKGKGGKLTKIITYCGDFQPETDSVMRIRIHRHSGTFGTTSTPENPADRGDCPTPGWIALSDPVTFTSASTPGEYTFTFSGDQQIRLVNDTPYVWLAHVTPADQVIDNKFNMQGSTTGSSEANGIAYNDGNAAGAVNHGTQAGWLFYQKIYETYISTSKVSGTDSGFANTVTPADTDPFTAGEKVRFTFPTLTDGVTYYYSGKVNDPTPGSATDSAYTADQTFTITLVGGGGGGANHPIHAFWFDPSFYS